MKEAAITQSPHAFVPKKTITEAEREELYRTRIDESFKPYTVIDVLQKVYHRSFADDLKQYIGEHPQKFRKNPEKKDWAVSNEEALFYKHRICAWLYCYEGLYNKYRHADTDEILTHSQVMSMIG